MPMPLIALMLQTTAAALPPVPPATTPTIVVTGRRLADYAADVAACVAAPCPPKQDIVVSIRYAEALFRSGNYIAARDVLAKATRRDDHAAAEEPLALSQLYLAQANVAAHYGEQRDFKAATYASARVADKYLAADDPDRLWADLRVADVRAHYDATDGEAAYARIAAVARAAGRPQVAAAADVHHALALHTHHHDAEALAILAGLTAETGEAGRFDRLTGRIVTALIARDRGDRAATDRVIRELATEPDPGQPILVYSPPLPRPGDDPVFDNFDAPPVEQGRRPTVVALQWVDIGFGIKPDGTVDTPEVLRASDSGKWAAPLVKTIAARRYAPSAATADDQPGHYRIERYTVTGDFSVPVGSLIRVRNRDLRYQLIDLTDPDQVPKAGG